MHDIKSFLKNLTHHAGVYQMLGANKEIIYVGKAKDLKKRVASYFNNTIKDPKTQSLVKQIHDIEITITRNENEAVLLECNLIKKHRPRYNILLRDDKSYPYIIITTQHDYPRIDIYRGPRKKEGLYFGPYPSSLAVRETIQLLQKLFRIRTCRDSYYDARTRPCLLYQIGRCTGPCVGLISAEEYAHNVQLAVLFLQGKNSTIIEELQKKMEVYADALQFEDAVQIRDQIARLRQIQDKQYVNVSGGQADIIGLAMEGNENACIQLLSIRGGQIIGSRSYYPSVPNYSTKEEVISAFLSQHYLSETSLPDNIPNEIIVANLPTDQSFLQTLFTDRTKQAIKILRPLRGNKLKWLDMANNSAKQSLALHIFSKKNIEERLMAVQSTLQLKQLPLRVECFDISHTMGEATVASCVVFDRQGPVKSAYRRFNITGITPGDDVAAMHQVLTRRFKQIQKDNTTNPDLIFIDGGKTQLNAADKVMSELGINGVTLIGVSKGPGRKPGMESLHFKHKPPIHLPADSLALHFIQHIRDEAHRFAITGHRLARDKHRRQSSLEIIPGIGAKRRRDLLRYFGGIQGISHASLDELMKVPGINKPLAERIFAAFHDATI